MANVKALIKLQLPAGAATPGPPVGSSLGQHGVAIGEFVKQFNDKTADQRGDVLPVVITVMDDRSFTFITKQPPMSNLIKKALGITSGSKLPGKDLLANILTVAHMRDIFAKKKPDLNARNESAGMKIVAGQARSMGIKTEAIPE